jgi:hypothetical protein
MKMAPRANIDSAMTAAGVRLLSIMSPINTPHSPYDTPAVLVRPTVSMSAMPMAHATTSAELEMRSAV